MKALILSLLTVASAPCFDSRCHYGIYMDTFCACHHITTELRCWSSAARCQADVQCLMGQTATECTDRMLGRVDDE